MHGITSLLVRECRKALATAAQGSAVAASLPRRCCHGRM